MKMRISNTGLLSVILLLAGCATPERGPAYGHESEFRQQLTDDAMVKHLGYTVRDVRFSDDYQKAVAILAVPANTNACLEAPLKQTGCKPAGLYEVTLKHDGNRRYRGMLYVAPEHPAFQKLELGTQFAEPCTIAVTLAHK